MSMMMSLRRRYGGGKVLPYDAEVEYLESTGTQYIDTNFKPNQNTNTYTEVYVSDGKIHRIFETRDYGDMTRSLGIIIFNQSDNQVQLRRWGRFYKSGKYLGKLNIRQNGRNLYINNSLIVTGDTVNFSIQRPILLFALNDPNYGHYTEQSAFRCYRFTIYDNDLIVRDLVPVRVGQVGYFYDKVSSQLFGNSGTGAFIVGPDVISKGGVVTNCKPAIYAALAERRAA